MKTYSFSIILLIIGLFSNTVKAQQIGSGYATTADNFNTYLLSGAYQTGLNQTGFPGNVANTWNHLFVIRHSNTSNNNQLQIASSYAENDRIFFRKINSLTLSEKNTTWYELATRGTNTFTGNQTINGTAQIEKLLVNHPNTATNWNNIWQGGFYEANDATNAPEPSYWFWGINTNHSSNSPTNLYGSQIVIRNSPTSPTMYFRSKDINGAGTWAKVLHSVGNQQINGNLDVAGFVRAYEVRVCLNQGCDYVFDDDYKLMNLNDLSNFVKTNKHLPEVAPAAQMENEGFNVSEMNALLLKKVEELTLYVIQQQETIDVLKEKIEKLGNK